MLRQIRRISVCLLASTVIQQGEGFSSFFNRRENTNVRHIDIQSSRIHNHAVKYRNHPITSLFATTADTELNGTNVPFFASSPGGSIGADNFFSSAASAATATKSGGSSDGKAASITTRVPLGSLFDSREYIFETVTNVR